MSKKTRGFRFKGTIRINAKGFAFITPDAAFGFDEDVYVSAGNTGESLSGDTVEAVIINCNAGDSAAGHGENHKYEAYVASVLEKAEHVYSGIVFEDNDGAMCVRADKIRYRGRICLVGNLTGIAVNDIVVFELIKLPAPYSVHGIELRSESDGIAEVKQVIGKRGETGADISAVAAVHGLSAAFSDEVLSECDKIPGTVSDAEISAELAKGRRDLRNLRIVTIDSAETKDVDDGVSVGINEKGNYMLGVHIADVTHYVKEGSLLDKEARLRGTSVYLADRVIPMLPRKLSNGICSLNQGEDRFALTVMMEINGEGTVISHEIFESIINVEYKITYDQLYELLDKNNDELKSKYGKYVGDLSLMRILASILNKVRAADGAIDFYFPETHVTLDERGRTASVEEYRLTFANNIIEEFMLICNQTVAQTYFWQGIPFIYRVHDKPSPERIEEFSEIVKNLGFRFKCGDAVSVKPKDYQDLMRAAEGHPFFDVISLLSLRSMRKAEYSCENRGHFGLAFKYYTHFTSPIRRYPDLFIHRMIKQSLSGMLDEEKEKYYGTIVNEIASDCSAAERNADEAERESVDLKVTEYMSRFIGEKFTGVVSGVTSFGIFVRLESSAEGLVRYESFRDDYFEYNPKRLTAKSTLSGKTVKIGDAFEVIVASCDIAMRKIEFVPAEEYKKRYSRRVKTASESEQSFGADPTRRERRKRAHNGSPDSAKRKRTSVKPKRTSRYGRRGAASGRKSKRR